MALFDRAQFEEDENEAGIHMSGLCSALVTWVAMNYPTRATIASAAATFNTTPAVIREAIDRGMWILYSGPDDDPSKQTIDLDGE